MVVDTNILIYAAAEAAPEHEQCRTFLQRRRESSYPWYLTWGVIYEFLRVATHPRVFRHPRSIDEAWNYVTSLLSTPNGGVLLATSRHVDVARQVIQDHQAVLRGNLVHDAHTVVLMREHGVREVATRDADFHRFSAIEVIDPVTED